MTNRKIGAIHIKPVQGFGNQINGILQGFFTVALFKKCLFIDWKYEELTEPIFRSLEGRQSKRLRTVSFPSKSPSSFKKYSNQIKSSRERDLFF